MTPADLQSHIAWLKHDDICAALARDDVPRPWFTAYRSTKAADHRVTWYSALVPPDLVPKLVKNSGGWDFHIGDGRPAIVTAWPDGIESQVYANFGNDSGIEPLVICRDFHGIRGGFLELAQEIRLYHNLYPVSGKKQFVMIDDNGDESEAARYGDDYFEIRTDLVLKFCAAKQVALAVYVDSFRYSMSTLTELGLAEIRTNHEGTRHIYSLAVVAQDDYIKNDFRTIGLIFGKSYVLPGPMPTDTDRKPETFQDFIIDTDAAGQPVYHTCDPDSLANHFGKNREAPHYLTPVFFRAEVMTKYYNDPGKYTVDDGFLRCGHLWGLRMDNDHDHFVVVYLGDLGRDLSEGERNYWLSYNIAPEGRTISETAFKRGMLAEFTDPNRPDLIFKHEYARFNRDFREALGWDFFSPLHDDDEHFLVGLRLLTKDNQAEFDSQLIALTKVLVDSLNEKEIAKGLTTLGKDDKGITKLEKYFAESDAVGYEPHVRFLRVLQDLRSKSAAHRKGSSYEQLVAELQVTDEGQQRVFATLLTAACELIRFLRSVLIPTV